MEEVFEQIETLAKTEKRVAMATLVATLTSPKKEGTKMWVSEAGRILGSVTIGGCVDARVIEESEAVLASSEPKVISIAMGEEDAWESGFTCAGAVQVLIEPLNLADSEDNLLKLYNAVRSEVELGKSLAIATPLADTRMRLVIFEDGTMHGTLGNEVIDEQARTMAIELVQKRISRTVILNTEASSAEIFFEIHIPVPTLIVFGAGSVSMPLVALARALGLKTIVVDGRPRFATRERFPDADELLIGIPSEIAGTLSYNSSTMVVLTAHDYKYDIPVLKIALKTEAAYIGLLSSRKRGQAILEFLRESGVNEESLSRVCVPTGLDIGAQSAAEIALSILAEAVAVRAGKAGRPMRERS